MTTLTRTHALGEPQVAGPLAVFPVFGPPALRDYRAFIRDSVLVAGLEHAGELVQLSAFPAEGGGRVTSRAASIGMARPARGRS